MKKPALLLHVGTHKTGTTAIQAALATNRSLLLDEGIHYPSLKPEFRSEAEGHHKIAHSLARFSLADQEALVRFEKRIFSRAKEVDLTIISAEPFYRHKIGKVEFGDDEAWFKSHDAYLKRVAEIFHRFDIIPVCYFRKPDEMAISLYKENIVKRNFRGELGEFIFTRHHVFDYARHIDALEANFGPVDVRIFEAEREKGLISKFLPQVAFLNEFEINQKQVRTSPSNKAALWLKQLSTKLGKRKFYRRALFAVRTNDMDVFGASSQSTLWSDNSQQSNFFEQYRRSYEPPFPWAPNLIGCPKTTWDESMHRAAEGAFRAWEAKNWELLRMRESMKLPLFSPDPVMDDSRSGILHTVRSWLSATHWPR